MHVQTTIIHTNIHKNAYTRTLINTHIHSYTQTHTHTCICTHIHAFCIFRDFAQIFTHIHSQLRSSNCEEIQSTLSLLVVIKMFNMKKFNLKKSLIRAKELIMLIRCAHSLYNHADSQCSFYIIQADSQCSLAM